MSAYSAAPPRVDLLADKQLTQEKIADSYTQILQYRLHVLYTAWLIDKYKEYNREVRKEIAAIKAATPKVLQDVFTGRCSCTAASAYRMKRHS